MPRTKEFEPRDALDAATELFWRRGYGATTLRDLLDGSGLDGVDEVFRRTVDGLVEFEPRRGCLMANTAVELSPHDAEVAEKVSRYVRRTEAAFEDALNR